MQLAATNYLSNGTVQLAATNYLSKGIVQLAATHQVIQEGIVQLAATNYLSNGTVQLAAANYLSKGIVQLAATHISEYKMNFHVQLTLFQDPCFCQVHQRPNKNLDQPKPL